MTFGYLDKWPSHLKKKKGNQIATDFKSKDLCQKQFRVLRHLMKKYVLVIFYLVKITFKYKDF